jgi:toxin ParE1/3/4
VGERIREALGRLLHFPMSGRIGRVEGARELIIDRTPQIAADRIADSTVRVLRLLRGGREWPGDF